MSLYDATIPAYLQTITAVGAFLEKGRAHCEEHGVDLGEIVETRVYPDMRPFRYQIVSVIHHSVGAVEAIRSGTFSPPGDKTEYDYSGLQGRLAEARDALQSATAAEIDARQGTDVTFVAGDRRIPFTAEGFVASFSLPNFYFHATTAYNILRSKGVPLGKRDYLGQPRVKA